MASKHGFFTVWEWEMQPCLWVPYRPKLCQCIEAAFRTSNGRVNLGFISQELSCFEINFASQREENIYTKESRRVRQKQYPSSCILSQGVLWEWQSDFTWELYDVPTMMYIETEFQKRQPQIDLSYSPLRIPNIVNFTQMVQINKITKKHRPIKRTTINEQYPLAVFQSTSSTRTITGAMMRPQVPANRHHSMHHSPASGTTTGLKLTQVPASGHHPMHHSPATGTTTGSMLAPQVPSSGHHPMHHSPATGTTTGSMLAPQVPASRNHPMYPSIATGTTTGSLLGLQVPASSLPINPSPAHNMVQQPKDTNSSKAFISSLSADPDLQDLVNKMKYIPQARSLGGPLSSFIIPVKVDGHTDDECAICLENLTKPSDYDIHDPGMPAADVQCVSPDIVQLQICKHLFHRMCLQKMYNIGKKNGCLQCPTCKTIHGKKTGNQPKNGTMDIRTNSVDIPGYPGSGSIIITYNFKSDIQGENHPNPGQSYVANGFPRTCYLPNNDKGKKVLKLLQIAFERQLTFTIGVSVTTGLANTVTWNDIHHKTEGYQNTSGFGYPDNNYLDNVLAELATHGITDED